MSKLLISGVMSTDLQPSFGKPVTVEFEIQLAKDGEHHIVVDGNVLNADEESTRQVRHALQPMLLVAQAVFPEEMKGNQ